MELPVSLQCVELLRAAALGFGLGLYYDVLRCIRGRSRVLTHLFDLLFGLTLLLSLLLFALYAGRGDFRLFAFVGILCGASLYFLLLSPLVCRLLRAVFRAILAPFRFFRRRFCFFSKKFYKFCKKTLFKTKKVV